jgi:hypothetical protein
MAEISTSYQPKVGISQGADTIYAKSDGNFKFYDTDRTGKFMRNMMRSFYTTTVWSYASASLLSGADVSTPPTITPAYGYHQFKVGILASKASCDVREAYAGDMLVFDMGITGSTTSLEILQTGINSASIFTTQGSRVSSILFAANDNSQIRGFLRLISTEDGKWSVAEVDSNVTVQAE